MKILELKSFKTFQELSDFVANNQHNIEIANVQIMDTGSISRMWYLYYWHNRPTITKNEI